MLSSQRSVEVDSFLIDYGHWHVRELELDGDKLQWMWGEMQCHPALFSAFTRDNKELFIELLQNRFSLWYEVVDDEGKILGVVYITDLNQGFDANFHVMFFDNKPSEKAELVKEIIRLVFARFPYLHRLTISVPVIYFATVRAAKRIGFVEEGRKRQSKMIKSSLGWCDEVILGLLAGEI